MLKSKAKPHATNAYDLLEMSDKVELYGLIKTSQKVNYSFINKKINNNLLL